MSAIESIQKLVSAWSVNFYAGWSIMKLFTLSAVLFVTALVVNYFFDKAGSR